MNPHVREKQIRVFGFLQERTAAWDRKSHEISFLLNKKEVLSLEKKVNKAKNMKFITRCKIQCAIYLRFTCNSCSRVVRCELGY